LNVGYKWQQGQVARPFDRDGKLPLLLGRISGGAPRNYFTLFGQIANQQFGIAEINKKDSVFA